MIGELRSAAPRIHSCAGVLLRLCATGIGGVLLLVDLSSPAALPWDLLVTGSGAVTVLVTVWLRPLRIWAPVAVIVSAAATLIMAVAADGIGSRSITEICLLPVLLTLVVRELDRSVVVAYAAVVAGAAVAVPLREFTGPSLVFFMVLVLGWSSVCLAAGVYLRSVDAERRRRTEDAKRGERLELARDLHDFVAHHITGIVVQAQAARFLAGTTEPDRDAYERMFGDIERSGVEALSSMRRLVGVLRSEEAATTAPAESLDELERLVGEYGKVGPPVSLEISPDVRREGLPYAVASTVNRLVTEALTNVRKHGQDVTRVVVRLLPMDGAVRVEVVDDGAETTRWRARTPSGGFGLTGMRERADALGGSLVAGHQDDGGWRVAAVLPLGPTAGQSRS
ncbi:histidine kinase [Phytomonospora sp. NPDC050363]|uniref:sensor histidine kinase n=1 Tax=Phytomonospora sp. NPDC050363 TaxID=3155642 RepID=UPI0033D38285